MIALRFFSFESDLSISNFLT